MDSNERIETNRTGIATAPERAEEMTDGMDDFPPSSHGNGEMAAEKRRYSDLHEPLGHVPMPPPGEHVDRDTWTLFMDKLGERLAFERTGVRLYDGLLAKLDAHGSFARGPTRDELDQIRAQELEHFRTLCESVAELQGDPTAVTPAADLAGQIGSGVGAVIADPRTDLSASLEAILVAELQDNHAWEALIELARNAQRDDIAQRFEPFAEHEQEHLGKVRAWLAAAQGRSGQ